MSREACLVTLVHHPRELPRVRLLIESLRAFGGPLQDAPIWLFEADPQRAPCQGLAGEGVLIMPLRAPEALARYPLGLKVCACARAEELAAPSARSLIFADPAVLIIKPPILFDLGDAYDAALRPVHIRNVGLPADTPLDGYWRRVYQVVSAQDVGMSVESFVDGQRLRAYFNTHAFAVNPAKGLLRRWLDLFAALVGDGGFQTGACADELRQVFLHQAILSALVAHALPPEHLRLLPPDYNYPYNLHASVPAERRPRTLNDLVCATYEERVVDPRQMTDVDVREPLRSWLLERY